MLLLAPPARADVTYAGQRPGNAAVFEVVDLARQFWAARGITGCPNGIMAWHAPDIDSADTGASGRGMPCSIWITDTWASYISDPAPARATTVGACAIIFHEVGHALGLGHTDHGVMGRLGPEEPWDCKIWARPRLQAYAARVDAAGEREKERKALRVTQRRRPR